MRTQHMKCIIDRSAAAISVYKDCVFKYHFYEDNTYGAVTKNVLRKKTFSVNLTLLRIHLNS